MASGKNFSVKETNYHAMFAWLNFTLCTSCVGLDLGLSDSDMRQQQLLQQDYAYGII